MGGDKSPDSKMRGKKKIVATKHRARVCRHAVLPSLIKAIKVQNQD